MKNPTPKTRSTTDIAATKTLGERKGRIELTSERFAYFRHGATSADLYLTNDRLRSLLERELEYQYLDPDAVKLPKGRPDGDFTVVVHQREDDIISAVTLSSTSSIRTLDPRRVDQGTYQFSNDMASDKKSKKQTWVAHISVQACLWILNNYIDKFLLDRKMSDQTDDDVVVSKKAMHRVLLSMFMKVDS